MYNGIDIIKVLNVQYKVFRNIKSLYEYEQKYEDFKIFSVNF